MQIPALVKFARRAERRTILELGEVRVQTVEHLLAALAGLEIDNVRIELIRLSPGFDGSAQVFVEAILDVGIVEQDEPAAVLHPENLTAESRNKPWSDWRRRKPVASKSCTTWTTAVTMV